MAKDSLLRLTTNDTPDEQKIKSVVALNGLLAQYIDLALMTKQAHWNLRGEGFIAVHEMLDGFRDGLDDHADTVAERVVQLGGVALGTVEVVAKQPNLSAYPISISDVQDHLSALVSQYAAVANNTRRVATELKDLDSIDILTQASRDLDKWLWFLESNLK